VPHFAVTLLLPTANESITVKIAKEVAKGARGTRSREPLVVLPLPIRRHEKPAWPVEEVLRVFIGN